MSNKIIPSPLDVLARVNAALESSGLKTLQPERDPLPLFFQLLDEWLLSRGLSELAQQSSQWPVDILNHCQPADMRQAVVGCYKETCQLSRAHGRLSQWNQRELDNVYQSMLSQLQQGSKFSGHQGY